jgi:methylisocitrate lyase
MQRPASHLVLAPLALDPLSAALAKRTGFAHVYLGGGGLGYQRAVTEALLTTTELADATRAITERVDIGVIVDGGVGFGDAVHMARTIRMIEGAGAVAIEIEDQVAPKRVHHHRGVEHLVSCEEMCGKIAAAAEARRSAEFALIVRCNAIPHEGLDAGLDRMRAYEAAGADLIMPMTRTPEQFAAVSAGTSVPLAAMTIGAGRPASELLAAGYALSVDPMSAQALAVRATIAGYAGMKAGTGYGMTAQETMAVIHDIGDAIGIDALYAIEERTTEPPGGVH